METYAADIKARCYALRQQKLMMGMSVIAGFCDSYGLLYFKTYVSFMSGNTTQTGFASGQHNLAAAGIALTAILFFMAGIFAAVTFTNGPWYRSGWMPFVLVAFLLTVSGFIPGDDAGAKYGGVAILSFAMGYFNNALSHVGRQTVNADFVTGNLSNSVQHIVFAIQNKPMENPLGTWDTYKYRAVLLIGIWFCFLAGAFLCASLAGWLGKWVLVLPVLALLLCPVYVRCYPQIIA